MNTRLNLLHDSLAELYASQIEMVADDAPLRVLEDVNALIIECLNQIERECARREREERS